MMPPESAVINTVNLFHLSVDRRDWDAARSCLAASVRVATDAGEDARELSGEGLLAMIRDNVELFSATQHLVSGHHVLLDGDQAASCRASYLNHHVSEARRWVLAGQQEVSLRRTDGGWRITAITLRPAWEEGSGPERD
jgi:SnoaL-like protein